MKWPLISTPPTSTAFLFLLLILLRLSDQSIFLEELCWEDIFYFFSHLSQCAFKWFPYYIWVKYFHSKFSFMTPCCVQQKQCQLEMLDRFAAASVQVICYNWN